MLKIKPRATLTIWKPIWPYWNRINSIQIYWTWISQIWFYWRRSPISHTPISHCANAFCCRFKWKMKKSWTSLSWPTFWRNAILNCFGRKFCQHPIWWSMWMVFSIPFVNSFATLSALHSRPLHETISYDCLATLNVSQFNYEFQFNVLILLIFDI